MQKSYTVKEVSKLLRIKRTTVNWFIVQKMIIPDIFHGKAGEKILLSFENVCEMYMLVRLAKYGFSHKIINHILESC